jgi:hypothetical protein
MYKQNPGVLGLYSYFLIGNMLPENTRSIISKAHIILFFRKVKRVMRIRVYGKWFIQDLIMMSGTKYSDKNSQGGLS